MYDILTKGLFLFVGPASGIDRATSYDVRDTSTINLTNTGGRFMKRTETLGLLKAIHAVAGFSLAMLLAAPVQAVPVSITNPSFETGDLTGWTLTSALTNNPGGAINFQLGTSPAAAQDGSWFYSGRANGSVTNKNPQTLGIFQRVDVSGLMPQIDAGGVTLTDLTGWGYGETGGTPDSAFLRLGFFDAVSGGSQIGSFIDSASVNQQNSWAQMSITNVLLPIGTKSIYIGLLVNKFNTNFVDAGHDNVSANLDVVAPEPSTMLLFGTGLAGLVAWRMKKKGAA